MPPPILLAGECTCIVGSKAEVEKIPDGGRPVYEQRKRMPKDDCGLLKESIDENPGRLRDFSLLSEEGEKERQTEAYP